MNLKDRKLQEAKTKLKVLEEKLKFLEFSNLQDKEEKTCNRKTKKNYKPYHKLFRINM